MIASMDLKLWVSVTVTLVSMMQAIIGFRHLELRIATQNKTQTDLQNTLLWWNGLGVQDKQQNKFRTLLVEKTETCLLAEVQSLQDALEQEDDHDEDGEHETKGTGKQGKGTGPAKSDQNIGDDGDIPAIAQQAILGQLQKATGLTTVDWDDIRGLVEQQIPELGMQVILQGGTGVLDALLNNSGGTEDDETCDSGFDAKLLEFLKTKLEPQATELGLEWNDVCDLLLAKVSSLKDLTELAEKDLNELVTEQLHAVGGRVLDRTLKQHLKPLMDAEPLMFHSYAWEEIKLLLLTPETDGDLTMEKLLELASGKKESYESLLKRCFADASVRNHEKRKMNLATDLGKLFGEESFSKGENADTLAAEICLSIESYDKAHELATLVKEASSEPDDDADAVIDPQLVWVDPDDAL